MQIRSSLVRAACGAAVLAAVSSAQVPVQLSDLSARTPVRELGQDWSFSPDGEWLVYEAEQQGQSGEYLYAARADGSGSSTALLGPDPERAAVSSDSTRVLARVAGDGVFVVAIDGGSPPVRIATDSGAGMPFGGVFTPDGTKVVYQLDERLWWAPSDGSATPVALTTPASGAFDAEEDVLFLADPNRVAFRFDNHFYTADLDPTPSVVDLTPQIAPGDDVGPGEIAASGTQIVFWAELGNNDPGIYRVPLDASTGQRLLSVDHQVLAERLVLTPDRLTVLYVGRTSADDYEYFRVAATGGALPVAVTALDPSFFTTENFEVSPDGIQFVFRAASNEQPSALRSIRLSEPPGFGTLLGPAAFVTDLTFSRDSQVVAYRTGLGELRTVPVDASAGSRAIASSVEGFAFVRPGNIVYSVTGSPDGNVFLRDRRANGAPVALGLSTSFPKTVRGLRASPDGTRVAFASDQLVDGVTELFVRASDASSNLVRVNDDLRTRKVGAVTGFEGEPNGKHVVYRADENTAGRFELFSVPADGNHEPVRLSADLAQHGEVGPNFAVSDLGRVVYVATRDNEGRMDLWVAPSAGGVPAVNLTTTLHPLGTVLDFDLAGDRVLFRYQIFSRNFLFSAPLDASTAPVRIDTPDIEPTIEAFEFDEAGARVVYQRSASVSSDANGLWSVPYDGSAAAIRLTVAERQWIQDFAISEDGTTVGFVSQLLPVSDQGLFVAPMDGSQPPQRISLASQVGSVSEVFAHPDGRYLYVLREASHTTPVLFSVLPDGSGVAQLGSGSPAVLEHVLPLAGNRVIYASRTGVFAVPADGSSLPIELGPPASASEVLEVRVTPDRTRAAFRLRFGLADQVGLFDRPLDGGGAPRMLNNPLSNGGRVLDGVVAGNRVTLFRARETGTSLIDLFVAPANDRPAVRMNPVGADVLAADRIGDSIVYTSETAEGVIELFSLVPRTAAGGAAAGGLPGANSGALSERP